MSTLPVSDTLDLEDTAADEDLRNSAEYDVEQLAKEFVPRSTSTSKGYTMTRADSSMSTKPIVESTLIKAAGKGDSQLLIKALTSFDKKSE